MTYKKASPIIIIIIIIIIIFIIIIIIIIITIIIMDSLRLGPVLLSNHITGLDQVSAGDLHQRLLRGVYKPGNMVN
jgi:hypothetical protein